MRALELMRPGPGMSSFARLLGMSPGDSEVHIWFATLERSSDVVGQLAEVLSEDERARAARFHFARDRRRFVVGRGWLRTILASYLEIAPRDVRLQYGEFGKPCLSNPTDLRFNLSHSDERVLCAVTRGHKIG